jgi:hypothetical protein
MMIDDVVIGRRKMGKTRNASQFDTVEGRRRGRHDHQIETQSDRWTTLHQGERLEERMDTNNLGCVLFVEWKGRNEKFEPFFWCF